MKAKKITALIAALSLVFSTGCGIVDSLSNDLRSGLDRVQDTIDLLSGEIYHESYAFEDMSYEHYDENTFIDLCRNVESYAHSVPNKDEARKAVAYLYEELCYINTMYSLAEIAYYQNPNNTKNEEELYYIEDVYNRMYYEYMYAIGAVAASDNAYILEDEFYTDTIDYMAEFFSVRDDDYALAESELFTEESRLVAEYYAIMSEEYPDFGAAAELFTELITLRKDFAAFYGYDSAAEYYYADYYYKDYTPEQSEALWAAAKEHLAPLIREKGEEYYDSYYEILDNYSIDCSPDTILEAIGRNIPLISEELDEAFTFMVDNGLYDIAPSSTKADLGYTTRLYYYDVPFIFNSPYSEFADYLDLIHELGHYANNYFTWSDLIFGYPDNDLCELQSQGLEMLFTACYEDIFGEAAEDIESYLLMNKLVTLAEGLMYDEFQQLCYAEENLTGEKATEMFCRVYEEYGFTPYEGYESEWIYVPHNFEYPFYYISYAVSALPALEIYILMDDNLNAAIEKYMEVCLMDTEAYYFSEALAEADFTDIFSDELEALLTELVEKANK
ncbi:MAG: hypothetical protein IKV79_04290 [Oscillospiraceae bacterium]|nr:hypothetical protein [Oscillospiraceae bacterium]